MHRDVDRHKFFSRRVALLAGGKALLLSTLIGRMYYLQVIESDRYATLADDNRINLRLLAPPRGAIVDRFGRAMAVNEQNYRVDLVSEHIRDGDVAGVLRKLTRIVTLSEAEQRRVLREVRRRRDFVPVTVRDNLEWRDVARIEVNTPDLPGIMIAVGESRYYPRGDLASHLLGYVSSVAENERTGDPLLELPGFRIGKNGIERVHDRVLRGRGGNSQVEVNAVGRVIRELSRKEGQPGAEVRLTIDLALQEFALNRFGDESGAVVVLDARTGAVLAMVSTPGFDPNAFNRGLGAAEWKKLVSDKRAPLTNKAISGQYAPGSTFKMVVALAALEKGAINPSSKVFCSGSIKLGDAEFHCWKKGGHGLLNLSGAITQSCDVFFYEAAKRTGIDRIQSMARRLGLGARTGIELPGERQGLVPGRQWKQAALGKPWQQGETLITGIGQGYLLCTPLQLAVLTAQLANGGLPITPFLTKQILSDPATPPTTGEAAPKMALNLNPAHLGLVRDAMAGVVNHPVGTAYRSRIQAAGMEMAGKTGTVQVRRISKAEREAGVVENKDKRWEERDHALFVGYAPVANPHYAIAVVVEHGGGGSSVAAPIARDILLQTQRRNSGGDVVVEAEAPGGGVRMGRG